MPQQQLKSQKPSHQLFKVRIVTRTAAAIIFCAMLAHGCSAPGWRKSQSKEGNFFNPLFLYPSVGEKFSHNQPMASTTFNGRQTTHHARHTSQLFICFQTFFVCDSPRRLRLPDCIVPPSLSIVCKNLMKNTPQMLPFH